MCNCVGQLSVEGGSRSYPEGVGRAAILRPQPVPCVSMPSLCYPLQETDCSYQSFCQHQLCCLHCRPAPSIPLEKYTLPLNKYSVPHAPEPGCSSPTNPQRCWNPDPAAQVHLSQNSVQQSPNPEPVKQPAADERLTEQGNPQNPPEKDPAVGECSENGVSVQTDEDTVSTCSGQRCACEQRVLQHLHL